MVHEVSIMFDQSLDRVADLYELKQQWVHKRLSSGKQALNSDNDDNDNDGDEDDDNDNNNVKCTTGVYKFEQGVPSVVRARRPPTQKLLTHNAKLHKYRLKQPIQASHLVVVAVVVDMVHGGQSTAEVTPQTALHTVTERKTQCSVVCHDHHRLEGSIQCHRK